MIRLRIRRQRPAGTCAEAATPRLLPNASSSTVLPGKSNDETWSEHVDNALALVPARARICRCGARATHISDHAGTPLYSCDDHRPRGIFGQTIEGEAR